MIKKKSVLKKQIISLICNKTFYNDKSYCIIEQDNVLA